MAGVTKDRLDKLRVVGDFRRSPYVLQVTGYAKCWEPEVTTFKLFQGVFKPLVVVLCHQTVKSVFTRKESSDGEIGALHLVSYRHHSVA